MYRYTILLQLVTLVLAGAENETGINGVLKNTFGTSCKLDDDVEGVCVAYYQCNKDGVVVTDKAGIIDLHIKDVSCLSYLDVCCNFLNVNATNKVVPPPQNHGCGWRNPQGVGLPIIGDRDNYAKFGELPWMVAIIRLDPLDLNNPTTDYLHVYVGGGSLIHPSVVMTAAHIVYRKDKLMIRAGEWDTQTTKEMYPYQDRNVNEIVVHEHFNRGNLFYDIALLFLQDPVEIAPNVGVTCLPQRTLQVVAGTRCLSSGWGKDKFGKEGIYQVIMKKIEIPVVERNICINSLRNTRLGRFFELHTSFMCAGGEVGKDTCGGDGGSPLVCPIEVQKDRYLQSGIVSWGVGCGQDGSPGVYVNVANMRDWVDNEVVRRKYDPSVYTY